jgi:hypothetical protein
VKHPPALIAPGLADGAQRRDAIVWQRLAPAFGRARPLRVLARSRWPPREHAAVVGADRRPLLADRCGLARAPDHSWVALVGGRRMRRQAHWFGVCVLCCHAGHLGRWAGPSALRESRAVIAVVRCVSIAWASSSQP